MMARSMGNKNTDILTLVKERALSKKEVEEEKKKQQENSVPYLPKECVSNVLVRLPLESLQRSRFVCKPWYNMIDSSIFINAHLRRSETVLIFLKRRFNQFCTSIPQEKPNIFSVEASLLQSESIPIFRRPNIDPRSKFYIHFMEITDGKTKIGELNTSCSGNIRATCNGLILLENKLKKGGLIVMNPVTRKLIALPVGTLCPAHDESYGFALSNFTNQYTVVHLFRDELGFIGCEILNLEARLWRVVNGPSFGLFGWFGYKPVSAIGALHWVPQIDHSDYIVSIGMDDEKFHTIPLPKSSRTHDRIIELCESLCFVTHEDLNQMDVWILKGLCGQAWTKQHSITVGCILDMVPLSSSRINGEMIFKRDEDGSLYAYDFQLQLMRKVEMRKGCIPLSGWLLPHVNSLVSWCAEKKSEDVCD